MARWRSPGVMPTSYTAGDRCVFDPDGRGKETEESETGGERNGESETGTQLVYLARTISISQPSVSPATIHLGRSSPEAAHSAKIRSIRCARSRAASTFAA